MKNILHTSQQRRMNLIQILFHHQGEWLALEDLAEMTHVTLYNLNNDITELRRMGMVIDTFHSSIRVNVDKSPSIEALYRMFNLRSPGLNIIEEIFYHDQHSSDSLSEKMNLSYSTIYRHVNILNQELEKIFNISIEKTPYQFSGKEEDIRYFLAEYFAERYPVYQWPFDQVKEAGLEKLIAYLTGELDIDMSFPSYYFVKISVAIALIRTFQGYRIEDISNQDVEAYYAIISQQEGFSQLQRGFKAHHGLDLDLDLLNQIFFPYVQADFFFSIEDMHIDARIVDRTKQSISFLSLMLSRLTREFDLELDNSSKLILEVHNTNALEKAELNVTPILYDQKAGFIYEVSQRYPEFCQLLQDYMRSYRKTLKEEDNDYMVNHLVYTIFCQWPNLLAQLDQKQEAVKILIISKYDKGHACVISDILTLHSSAYLDVDIYEGRNLDLEAIQESDCEMVISNFDLPELENKQRLYLPNSVTNGFLGQFNSKINEILIARDCKKMNKG